jgi:hypothetical protein
MPINKEYFNDAADRLSEAGISLASLDFKNPNPAAIVAACQAAGEALWPARTAMRSAVEVLDDELDEHSSR